MLSNSDLEKWQKAILGIEVKVNELSPEEQLAFQKLKELFAESSFTTTESGSNIKVFRDSLKFHAKNRLLSAHLKNFIEVCDKCFTHKVVTIAPPPVLEVPTVPVASSPTIAPHTFGNISQIDKDEWQKSIAGIEAKQSELSSDELSAFEMLKENCRNGNFTSEKSISNIQIVKNLQKRTKNRLLLIHLNKFVQLCEKYFKETASTIRTPTFTPPVITLPKKEKEPEIIQAEAPKTQEVITVKPIIVPPSKPDVAEPAKQPKDKNKTSSKGSNNNIIFIVIAAIVLIGGWQSYKNWNTEVKPFLENLGLINKTASDTCIVSEQEIPVIIDTDSHESDGDELTVIQQQQGQSAQRAPEQIDQIQQPITQKNAVKTYNFGKYVGSLKNGIPEGNGKLTYSRRVQIAKHDTDNLPHYAEAGDYFNGSWGNGDIVSGYLYSSDGNIKDTIRASKRFNPYDISKD